MITITGLPAVYCTLLGLLKSAFITGQGTLWPECGQGGSVIEQSPALAPVWFVLGYRRAAKGPCRGRENVGTDRRTEEVLTVGVEAVVAAAAEAVVAVAAETVAAVIFERLVDDLDADGSRDCRVRSRCLFTAESVSDRWKESDRQCAACTVECPPSFSGGG